MKLKDILIQNNYLYDDSYDYLDLYLKEIDNNKILIFNNMYSNLYEISYKGINYYMKENLVLNKLKDIDIDIKKHLRNKKLKNLWN